VEEGRYVRERACATSGFEPRIDADGRLAHSMTAADPFRHLDGWTRGSIPISRFPHTQALTQECSKCAVK